MKAFIYSADLLTPQALEIMGEVKRRVLGDLPIEFDDLPEYPPVGCTVFALGNYKPSENVGRVVPAPSVAQICTSPETVTRLGQAFELLVNPPVLPKFEYRVLGYVGACAFLLQARDSVWAFDIETSGVVGEDRAEFSRVISIAIYNGHGAAFVIPEDVIRQVKDELNDFIAGNGFCTINGQFDFSYFEATPKGHFDAQIAHYILFPAAREHGLKPVAKKKYGFDDWDEPAKVHTPKASYNALETFEDGSWHDQRDYPKGSGYERIPRAMLYEYNAFDVYATWPIYKWTLEMLAADTDSMEAFKHLMRVQEMAMEWEANGYHLNVPYIAELSEELHVEQEQAEEKLNQIVGMTTNPRSPKQVKDRFLEEYGITLPSTDKEAINEFLENYGPDPDNEPGHGPDDFARQLLKCRDIAKTLGTYVDGYRKQADEDGRVYPGFKLIASTTGRIGGKGASLLTIPREKRLKKMVIPDPGQYMVGADLSQAELRVMAMESEDPWLIEAFQPGAGDFFDILLGQAYPEYDWTVQHALGGDSYNNKRAAMKGVVYGVSFGRGTRAIARALKIPEKEAQILVDAFIRPGSPFDLWRDDITDRAITGKPIVTRFGRHFQSELVTYRNRQNVINSALAFTSQSTANDICLLAALEATPKLREHGYRIISSLHDAIYTSGPEESYEAAGTVLVECLQTAGRSVYGDAVSFDADWGHGRSMADV